MLLFVRRSFCKDSPSYNPPSSLVGINGLLQALAYQMHQEEARALEALSEAVRLAEPEGYIRSFVDEGSQMEALFYQLRQQERKSGLTPYLDTLFFLSGLTQRW